MKDVQVQRAPTEMQRLETESALMITRSLHSDLDIEAVVQRLFTYMNALTQVTYVHYSNEQPHFLLEIGEQTTHSMTYELRLTSQTETAGTIAVGSDEPLNPHDREVVEELLTLAANALRNAHQFYGLNHKPTTNSLIGDKKMSDALVLARIDGLDTAQAQGDTALPGRIMSELRIRLGNSLREADGTLKVDENHIAIVLPATATGGAQRVAEKLSRLIDELDFVDPVTKSALSVSVGISSTNDSKSAAAVLASAKGQLTQTGIVMDESTTVH
ncbi:MAG: diguanylate cyclase [Pseudomonadota bacterium]